MAEILDPLVIFDLVAAHVPPDLQPNLFIIGSLAAAYHHRGSLRNAAVNTKDADIAIQPAGSLDECAAITDRLLGDGWRPMRGVDPEHDCVASASRDPIAELRVVRLYPPTSDSYFIELLAMPPRTQRELRADIPFRTDAGWFRLPSFRFLSLAAVDKQRAHNGLEYAHPAMMALANLVSHEEIGSKRISQAIAGRRILRAAKDLGRVLALGWHAGIDEIERWPHAWERALRSQFPDEARDLALRASLGLDALLANDAAFEDALHAVNIGLLAGLGVTSAGLRDVARRVRVLALEPLADRF
jgi:hypothetical protein